jgi:hypothetical protein
MQADTFTTTTLAANSGLLWYLYRREETRKKLLQEFREHGAVDAQHAIAFQDATGSCLALLRWLLSQGIVKKTQAERYYLDECAYAFCRRREMRVAWLLAGVILLGVASVAWFTSVQL